MAAFLVISGSSWAEAQVTLSYEANTAPLGAIRALTLQILGRRDEALVVLEGSTTAVSRVRPRTNTEMNTLHRTSVAYERDGQPAKALEAVARGVALARDGTPGTTPTLLSGLLLDEARVRLQLGEAVTAARLAQEAIDTAKAKNALSPTIEAEGSTVLGEAAAMEDDLTNALELARRAQGLSTGDAFAAKARPTRGTPDELAITAPAGCTSSAPPASRRAADVRRDGCWPRSSSLPPPSR